MIRPEAPHAPLACELTGDGEPVVFLHGLTFDRRAWRPVIDRLGDHVLSIAVDLPGHGQSRGPALTFDRLVPLLRARLDDLGVERPILVGHSISGGLALTYAAEHPVRGVVDVDQPLDLRAFASFAQELAPALRGAAFDETFRRAFGQGMGLEGLAPQIRGAVLAGQRIDRDVVLASWADLLEHDPEALQAHVDEVAETVTAPVFAVFGHELAPGDLGRLARLRDAEWEIWPGHGHFPHLVDPDRFAARLLAFVADAARRPSPAAAYSAG